jgi:hypothetical protein
MPFGACLGPCMQWQLEVRHSSTNYAVVCSQHPWVLRYHRNITACVGGQCNVIVGYLTSLSISPSPSLASPCISPTIFPRCIASLRTSDMKMRSQAGPPQCSRYSRMHTRISTFHTPPYIYTCASLGLTLGWEHIPTNWVTGDALSLLFGTTIIGALRSCDTHLQCKPRFSPPRPCC